MSTQSKRRLKCCQFLVVVLKLNCVALSLMAEVWPWRKSQDQKRGGLACSKPITFYFSRSLSLSLCPVIFQDFCALIIDVHSKTCRRSLLHLLRSGIASTLALSVRMMYTLQCILTLAFIWTVEVYSLIKNTIFVSLCFDMFVVIGFIRWRRTERQQHQSTSANQRSFTVGRLVVQQMFIHVTKLCFLTFFVIA